MKYTYSKIILIFTTLVMVTGCVNIADRKTTMEVEDNDRHYYPLLAGEQKDLNFKLKNTGENPLMITDIITSCGCLKVDESLGAFSVPSGKERMLTLSYNSSKNIGYVKHYITLYGNFDDAEFKEISFDINVVPNAMYTKDYEELHTDEVNADGGLKRFVDGDENNKGYYMMEGMKRTSKER